MVSSRSMLERLWFLKSWEASLSRETSIGEAVLSSIPSIMPDDLAALHDKSNPLEFGDVVQRIAGDSDQIGVLPLLN